MKIITVEEHFSNKAIQALCQPYIDPSLSRRTLNTSLQQFYHDNANLPALYDLDARLQFMADNGIDHQILSYSNTIPTEIPADKAVEIYQKANNLLAETVALHPDKFSAFALLPLQDPMAAAQELERCITQLGFKGTLMDCHFNGHNYDEPAFLPVFAKAAELGVPVMLHPSFVDKQVVDYYYQGDWQTDIMGIFASAGFGWHLDVGVALIRLILSGIFDKYPSLQIISGHWGEVVAYYIERMNVMLRPERTGLKKSIHEYYKSNIWLTPSGMLNETQLKFCIDLVGADRILYALDYPYVPLKNADKFLQNSPLSNTDKAKIAYQNAQRLFNLTLN